MDEPVTIIGAGIIGICCALSLRERDVPVRVIDRGAPGQETSFGNAGVISPWSVIPQSLPGVWKNVPGWLLNPSGPLSVRPAFWPRMVPWGLRFLGRSAETSVRAAADAMETLCAPSIEIYRRHLQGTGHEHLIADSHYVHAFRKAGRARLDAIDYRIRREKGADLALIRADELRRLEPALSRDFTAAILIRGQARALSPGRIAVVLAEKARAAGAEFLRDTVTGLSRRSPGLWEIRTDSQVLTARRVVLAAGVWSRELLAPLGVRVPLVAERGYHVEFPTPGIALRNSVMDVDAKIVASSMTDGLRVAGQSEFADPMAAPNLRRQRLIVRQARAMCPDLDPSGVSFWMGRRPSLPDSLPVLGRIDGYEGLFGAFGHSHYGLMMAPKTGELVADLISGRQPNLELGAYAANRF